MMFYRPGLKELIHNFNISFLTCSSQMITMFDIFSETTDEYRLLKLLSAH